MNSTIAAVFKITLKDNAWFNAHKNICFTQDGLPWVGAKIYVLASQRLKVTQLCHDTKQAGHFGFVKTLHLIKRQFWWPSLKKDIKSYVSNCPICALAKQRQGKTPGPFQTLAKSSVPWTEISMHFIVELPESSGNTVIWVVTNYPKRSTLFLTRKYPQLRL